MDFKAYFKRIDAFIKTNIRFIFVCVIVIFIIILIKNKHAKNKNKRKQSIAKIDYNDPEQLIKLAQSYYNDAKYFNAISCYHKLLDMGRNDALVYIADLYYSLTKGDAESALLQHAIFYYKQAIDAGYIDCLLTLADIYNYYDIVSNLYDDFADATDHRMSGLSPSKRVAYKLYTFMCESDLISQQNKITAQEHLEELNKYSNLHIFTNKDNIYNNPHNFILDTDEPTQIDVYGAPIVGDIHFRGRNEMEQQQLLNIQRRAQEAERQRLEAEHRTDQQHFTRIINIIDNDRDQDDIMEMNNFIINLGNLNRDNIMHVPTQIKNDPQNVHETSVVKGITKSISNLQKNIDTHIKLEKATHDIRDYINNAQIDEQKKKNAIKTLDACEKNISPLMSSGVNDSEVLRLVWSRIHHKENADRQNDLKNNLVTALADSVERGSVVCATGRVSHIIGALDKTDANEDIVDIKPEWAIREEIGSKVNLMLNNAINSASPDVQEAYYKTDNLSDIQKETVDKFFKTTKDNIKKEIKKDYNVLLSKDKLNNFVAEYVDTIN